MTRLKDVLSHLNEFFFQESDDRSNARAVRSLAEDLFIRTNDLKFLDFLYDALPMLASIYKPPM